jgi:two-component system sensor histidine kinase VicK
LTTRAETDTPSKLRRYYPGINARIVGPFLLLIIVISGIGVFTVTRLVAGSVQERFSNQLADSANAATNSIVDIEQQQLATLRLMSFTDGMSDAIKARKTGDLDQWLRPVAANAGIDEVIVFDNTGRGIYHLKRVGDEISRQYNAQLPPPLDQWRSVQNVVKSSADGIGDKFLDIIGRAPNVVFYTSAPVIDGSGGLVGGISVGLTANRVAERVGRQALSGVTLLTSHGEVLATTLRTAPDALALRSAQADRLVSAVNTSSPIEEINLSGTPYQMLYAPLRLRNEQVGLLAVALPSNFIVERSSTSRDILGVLFSLLFAGVTALGLLTARSITRPVARLVETTRAIRSGDLTRRVKLRTPDELGELGVSFDHMTDQLVKRNQKIKKMYLEQLQETARREAVLTSISDAVIVQDSAGQVLWQNGSAETLLKRIKPHREAMQEFMRLYRQPTRLTEARTVTLLDQHLSVLAMPVCMQSGELLGHVIVFRDITPLVEAERLKDELILQMSHELRTPLAAARGYIDLVRMFDQSNISEQSIGFVDNAVTSLDTLERLINQVIDVSAVVSDRFRLNIEQFNLVDVLWEQVTTWTPLLGGRELTLSTLIETAAIPIEGDRTRLEQVLDHVLRNAYSYTLPGGSIDLYARSEKHHAVIVITDSGVGIAPDEIDKVFERLYRGRSADAGPTDARGLGLGLYLSRRIVEAHGGTIHLESQIDVGTTATITLPLRQEHGST